MKRREFLKLLGASALGLVFPKSWEKRTDMIGDLLARLGKGELLTPREQEKLKMWGNNTELLGDFTAGLQTGQSDLQANQLVAQNGDFTISPNNASYFETNADTVTTSAFLDFDFQSKFTSESMIVPYEDATDKFALNSTFIDRTDTVFRCSIGVQQGGGSPFDNAYAALQIYNKSDDSSAGVYYVFSTDTGGDPLVGYSHGSIELLNNYTISGYHFADYYFKVQLVFGATRQMQARMFCERVM